MERIAQSRHPVHSKSLKLRCSLKQATLYRSRCLINFKFIVFPLNIRCFLKFEYVHI